MLKNSKDSLTLENQEKKQSTKYKRLIQSYKKYLKPIDEALKNTFL
jgi:hypothetical protein